MNSNTIDRIREVLSKDRDSISTNHSISFIKESLCEALRFISIDSNYEDLNDEDKVKVLILLGFGRDKTIYTLKELKIKREDIKKAKDSMNNKQNLFRRDNERTLTRFKIESSNRARRAKVFEEVGAEWKDIAKRYISGEPLHKISKETGVNIHAIRQQLKDDGIHDESKSTLLKKQKADELYKEINDDFIIQLIKNNPLDSKDLWWEKAKEEYPWILRRQLFQKLKELNLERSEEEENELRRIKSIEYMKSQNISKESVQVNQQLIKINSKNKIKEVFGSVEKLVELYMSGELGSYNKIAKLINKESSGDVKISVRQVEKAITRHPVYIPKKSYPQMQLFKFTKESFPEYEVIEEYPIPGTNKRIDVFIKDIAVGLEFNGDYWHSDEVIKSNYGVSSEEFHESRVEEASLAGIKICYIWENDWNNNHCVIEDLIINKSWDSELLNRVSNKSYFKKVIAPDPNKSN